MLLRMFCSISPLSKWERFENGLRRQCFPSKCNLFFEISVQLSNCPTSKDAIYNANCSHVALKWVQFPTKNEMLRIVFGWAKCRLQFVCEVFENSFRNVGWHWRIIPKAGIKMNGNLLLIVMFCNFQWYAFSLHLLIIRILFCEDKNEIKLSF